MKTTGLAMLTALAALACGCTKENDNGSRTGTAALSISTVSADRMPVKSVITETALSSGEIGLFLTATDGGNYDGKTSGYSNIKYGNDGGGWTSESPIMLSATDGVLYGYFPYNSSANDLTAIPVESSLNGADYMYATPVTGV